MKAKTATSTSTSTAAAPQTERLVGCPECDLLVRLPLPAPGDTATCPRCQFTLASGVPGRFRRPLAFAVTALILMVISGTFPFLSINAAGLESSMTLATAATSLTRFGANAVAVLVLAFVVLVPGLLMLAVATLTALLAARRPNRALVPLARSLFHLDAWSMADVFAIGVIVSLVKLSSMADVSLGPGFWAYLGFAVCALISATSLDRIMVWDTIDELSTSR
jgi:paraquat-inducible protein A